MSARKPRRWIQRLPVVASEPMHAELLRMLGLARYLDGGHYLWPEKVLARCADQEPIMWWALLDDIAPFGPNPPMLGHGEAAP